MKLIEEIHARAEAQRIPFSVLLELTQECSESCIHCCIKGSRDKHSLSRDNEELTLEQIKALLDELADEGAFHLTLSGGDPLMRSDFFEIASHAKERNFAIKIFSNGQLIDETVADKLAKIFPVCVSFSLYGACAATHDRITRLYGSFDKLMRAISLLQGRGVNVGLKTIVMRQNYPELERMFALGKRLGVKAHEFGEEITLCVDGSSRSLCCQIDDSTIFDYYSGTIPVTFEEIEELPLEEALKRPTCGAGVFGVCVSSFGDVFPCAELRSPLGNVKYSSFRDIWRRETGFLAELLSIKTFADLPDCRHCEIISFCRRCSGRAFAYAADWRLCYANALNRAQLNKKINEELLSKKGAVA